MALGLLLCTGFLQLWPVGLLFVVVYGLLVALTALAVGHGLLGMWASVLVVRRLSCPVARRTFPDQGLSLCPMHWQRQSLNNLSLSFWVFWFPMNLLFCLWIFNLRGFHPRPWRLITVCHGAHLVCRRVAVCLIFVDCSLNVNTYRDLWCNHPNKDTQQFHQKLPCALSFIVPPFLHS